MTTISILNKCITPTICNVKMHGNISILSKCMATMYRRLHVTSLSLYDYSIIFNLSFTLLFYISIRNRKKCVENNFTVNI